MSIISKETIIGQLESSEEFPIALSDVWEWLGYSRKDPAVRAFEGLELLQGEDFEVFHNKAENLKGGRPTSEIKMTIDCFKLWAMSAQTTKGKEVRRYYLQIEKEWKAQKTAIPQVTSDQVEAFMFQKDVFAPWVKDHPIAATVFVGWQGVTTTTVDTRSLNPSIEAQKALDGAFLNLNRSGLMMNKLFHFLDRIPTMKALDEDFVNEMVSALSESERVRATLTTDLKTAVKRSEALEKENKRVKAELKAVTIELERLKREQREHAPSSKSSAMTTVWKGKIPPGLKSAN